MKRYSPSFGFTLVEMAVVILVISIVAGMGIVATMGALETARRSQTEAKLNAIEDALLAFRKQYNRLPCPASPVFVPGDTSYGEELVDNIGCNANETCTLSVPCITVITNTDGFRSLEGGVPARSLGLPDEFMFDGWGRRFTYSVDELAASLTNAFDIIPPQANDCSITVNDASNNARASGAIYALMSHGPNGHGAFTYGENRVVAGVTNTQEQTNCRCNSSAAFVNPTSTRFVQREPVGSTTVTAMFDDIVRYKERWELQNEDDYVRNTTYREYQLAVKHSGDPSYWYGYRPGCHGWRASPTAKTLATNPIYDLMFSPNNDNLLTVSATLGCLNYPILGNSIDGTGITVLGCGYTTTSRYVRSGNGYIGITNNASPYIRFYRLSGTSTYTYLPNTTAIPTFYSGDAPTAQPTIIALSPNADYLFLTDRSTYASMYARINDTTFRKLTSTFQPVSAATCPASLGHIGAATFSRNGRYFAVSCGNNLTPGIKAWTIDDGTPFISTGTNPFTSLTGTDLDAVTFASSVPGALAFSPDSQFLAASGGVAASGGNVSDVIKIFKIDAGDTFTDVSPGGTFSNIVLPYPTYPNSRVVFSYDGTWIIAPYWSGTFYGAILLRRNATTGYDFVSTTASPFYSVTSYMDRISMIY